MLHQFKPTAVICFCIVL